MCRVTNGNNYKVGDKYYGKERGKKMEIGWPPQKRQIASSEDTRETTIILCEEEFFPATPDGLRTNNMGERRDVSIHHED